MRYIKSTKVAEMFQSFAAEAPDRRKGSAKLLFDQGLYAVCTKPCVLYTALRTADHLCGKMVIRPVLKKKS